MHEQALDLASRTRDLRVAVMLVRSSARQHGVQGYAAGLAIVAGLLERYWEHVFPVLDAQDKGDPTMRLNALRSLVDSDTGMADLRSADVGGLRPPLTVRHIELVTGAALPFTGEALPTQASVGQALAKVREQTPGLLDSMRQTHTEFKRIEAVLAEKGVAGAGPDLRPLGVLLKCLADSSHQARGTTAAADDSGAPADAQSARPWAPAPSSELRSRDDVVRLLDRACDWIERNEPTNPAPLLIRRAQRLMNKSFIDIIRDLVPEGLDQVEKIAGSAGG